MSLILSTLKNVNRSFSTLNETISYTIRISNTGSFDALGLVVTDLIPQGVNFITNSLFVDSVNLIGVDPAMGINIGTLPIGDTTTLTMSAIVVDIPFNDRATNSAQLDYEYFDVSTTPNLVSMSIDTNNVATTIQAAVIDLNKSSTVKAINSTIQIIDYKIKLTNNGNLPADNIVIIDTIPIGTTFIPNSVNILGTTIIGATIDPPSGFNYGTLNNGFYTEVSFAVQVISIPSNKTIENQGKVNYSYTLNNIQGVTTIVKSQLSNLLIIPSSLANPNLSGFKKYVDKNFSTTDDTITYTIVIPNTGTVAALDVALMDTIPYGTIYVPNSGSINGVSITSFSVPFNIGNIDPEAVVTIIFKVKVY